MAWAWPEPDGAQASPDPAAAQGGPEAGVEGALCMCALLTAAGRGLRLRSEGRGLVGAREVEKHFKRQKSILCVALPCTFPATDVR